MAGDEDPRPLLSRENGDLRAVFGGWKLTRVCCFANFSCVFLLCEKENPETLTRSVSGTEISIAFEWFMESNYAIEIGRAHV